MANMLLRAAGKERKPLATLVAGLVSIGTAMELFGWMARHRDHPLARTIRLPGIEVQRLFTTSEPSEDQLDVANEALQELLRLEQAAPAGLSRAGAAGAFRRPGTRAGADAGGRARCARRPPPRSVRRSPWRRSMMTVMLGLSR